MILKSWDEIKKNTFIKNTIIKRESKLILWLKK